MDRYDSPVAVEAAAGAPAETVDLEDLSDEHALLLGKSIYGGLCRADPDPDDKAWDSLSAWERDVFFHIAREVAHRIKTLLAIPRIAPR
jgi:hypothetical protein